MLTHLLIKNYVLIDHLELPLSPGLTIITGETGAGKSILLGAIGLLLGQRAETRVLQSQDSKCIIEGTFELSGYGLQALFEEEELDYAPLTLIRREITPSGKSRAFVNDTPVNLDLLKRITEKLIDVHSQHDSILLGNGSVQTDLLDAFGSNTEKLRLYEERYDAYKKAEEALRKIKEEAGLIRKENDYHHYLWQELDHADLRAGETAGLESELAILEHAAEIKAKFLGIQQGLDGQEVSALTLLNESAYALQQINRLAPAYQALAQRLQDVLVELKDISGEIDDAADQVEINDERMATVAERLDNLYQLTKKHQVGHPDELIKIRDDLRLKIDRFESLDAVLKAAEKESEEALNQMLAQGRELSKARKAIIPRFEELISSLVRDLGIAHAVFQVNLTDQATPARSGLERVDFLFSANKGLPPQPLRNVASGGEFSRLMLAFKYAVAEKKQLGTLIFDEIDSGISGEIARKMGEMLKQMARKHQLITITHLHQIAAFGDQHLFVYKDNTRQTTISKIRQLSEKERIEELAQMIGGQNPSESVVANARELLKNSL